MNENDLISVIIPVHNGEKFISRTLNRLYRQTYKNLEIIIVLNNCTDQSEHLCRKFQENAKERTRRIEILTDDIRGLTLVRKRGVLESHGKYIILMDIDDYYADDTAIEKMHAAIVEDGVQICQFSHYVQYYGLIRKQVDVVATKTIMDRETLFSGPLMGVVPGRGGYFDTTLWSKIYDGNMLRNAIFECTVPVFYQEDLYINFLAFVNEKTKKVSTRKEAYYVYCRYGGSMTDDPEARYRLLADSSLFKPVEYSKLNDLPVSQDIVFRVHSESIWAYRACINGLLYDRKEEERERIIGLISDCENYEYIRMTKEYFRLHPERIWSPEMHFMISDYTPEEYLQWCKDHLPKLSTKRRIRNVLKRIL